jgi:hypothetical protein
MFFEAFDSPEKAILFRKENKKLVQGKENCFDSKKLGQTTRTF